MDEQQASRFQFAGQDIPSLLAELARTQPDKPLLVWVPHGGATRTWSYRQFWDDVRSIGAGLAGRGVVKGDRVLIHCDNCPEMVLAWYACAAIGAVGVTTNTKSMGAEITYFAEKTGCVGAVTQPRYVRRVSDAAPGLAWIVVTDDDSGEASAPADLEHGFDPFWSLDAGVAGFCDRVPDPMAPAGILFTSGTTSRPKAVVHTHANALWAGRVGPVNISMTGDDTYLIYLPFFHVNAQSWSMWTALGVGATVVLQPKFSTSRFWDVVGTHHVTHISLIPFVFKALAGLPVPPNPLEVGVFGLVMPELEAWLGIRVVPAFGMTETVIHVTSTSPWRSYPTRSMGKPTPGYELIIVDPETGHVCDHGEPGELWVRGARGIQLFLEYFDDPEAMENSFTADGWFKTGDIVRLAEDGNFVYCERGGDMLKVGAENVSAREVEDVCRTVAGVVDVAVVGLPHEMLDEVAVAFVIAAPGTDPEGLAAEVITACGAVLADFKVPRTVYVVEEFPRATLDKVAKNRLRDMAKELAAPASA